MVSHRRHMKERPATTTEAAKFSFPRRFKRSRLVHKDRLENMARESWSSASLSPGSLASRRMLRKVSDMVGVSVFHPPRRCQGMRR